MSQRAKTSTRTALWTAFVIGLAIAGAACGSSHPARSAAPQTTVATTPAITSPPAGDAPTTTLAAPAAPSPTTTTSSTAPTTATATGTVTPVCATAHLSLSDLGGQGAAGHSIITYQFTNTSSTPCTLTGYPGVSILNAQSQIVQHPATRVPGPGTTTPIPVTTITMAGGSHAVFVLSSTDTVPNPDCPTPYYGTKLRVYPPGNTQPLQLPFTGAFCDLVIGPVHSP